MPRRASSSVHPIWIVAVVVLLAASLAGGYVVYTVSSDPFRTVPSLNVQAYLENANSLRGNTYKIDATILSPLAWSPTAGRLFSVEVDSDNGAEVLPVLIPAQFNHMNIQKGQRFFFRIEVGDKGILRAQDLRKA